MIDRSYLPYKSAREYQDRKMAKWMGFFLSEHTSAMKQEREGLDYSRALALEVKLTLINQLYAQKLKAVFTILEKNKVLEITGTIDSLVGTNIGIQAEDSHHVITLHQLFTLRLDEELSHGI